MASRTLTTIRRLAATIDRELAEAVKALTKSRGRHSAAAQERIWAAQSAAQDIVAVSDRSDKRETKLLPHLRGKRNRHNRKPAPKKPNYVMGAAPKRAK